MKRVVLDSVDPAVKEFIRRSLLDPEGVELEMEGEVIGKIVGPHQLTEDERDALLTERWRVIRRARERNKGTPAKEIEREVQDAIKEVRQRKQR